MPDFPQYPLTDSGVWAAFETLGLDPDDIADELMQMGYRGIPGSDCKCPIAHYLTDAIEGCRSVGIYLDDSHEGQAHAELTPYDGESFDVALPAAVIVFIRRFDSGRRYQELAEKEEAA